MRYLVTLLVVAVVLSAACAWAADNSSAKEVYIFKGDDPSADGIEIGGYGSGKAVKARDKILTGSQGSWSVKITTHGMYAGGRMDFSRPVALFTGGIDTKRYIQFAFFFNETRRVDPSGNSAWFDIDPYTVPQANKIRFVFISDNDVTVEAQQPTCALDPDDNWMRVAVPLAKFKVKEDISEFRLKRLLIFTDVPSTLYLGEMKLITDNTPITVQPLDSQTVAIMDQLAFVADADGGVSSLKYAWDFDNSNGIQPEQTEKVARYVYTRGGDFTVSLTVSDYDGLKQPVTVTTTISVIE